MTNSSPSPLPAPFKVAETQVFHWDAHNMSLDYPQPWKLYEREHLLVLADINDENEYMIPNAIDGGMYQLQYSAYPEVAVFTYPELSLEERLEDLGDCLITREDSRVQADCEYELPGDHGTEQVRYNLFKNNGMLYELAISANALDTASAEAESILDSINFS